MRGRNRVVGRYLETGKGFWGVRGGGPGADQERREEHEQKSLSPRAALLSLWKNPQRGVLASHVHRDLESSRSESGCCTSPLACESRHNPKTLQRVLWLMPSRTIQIPPQAEGPVLHLQGIALS